MTTERIVGDPGDHRVAVVLSLSGSIDIARVPAQIKDGAVYEMRPEGIPSNRDLIRSDASLKSFSRAWREFLSHVEALHPGAQTIDVVPAVPLSSPEIAAV